LPWAELPYMTGCEEEPEGNEDDSDVRATCMVPDAGGIAMDGRRMGEVGQAVGTMPGREGCGR
jgi:hypothetical protein